MVVPGDTLVQKAIATCESLFASTRPEGQEPLHQEIRQLSADWDSLKTLLNDTRRTLEKCLTAWTDFTETRDKTKNWLNSFQKKVGWTVDLLHCYIKTRLFCPRVKFT